MLATIFAGKTAVIVGGGPSLIGFDFLELDGLSVIAINRALEVVPTADVLWWTDARFWRRNKAKIMAHGAPHKATTDVEYDAGELPPEVHVYRATGKLGFDPRQDCIRHGNNSAYAAMHLAIHMGAAKIVLLGVDMRHGPRGETHFHSGHGFAIVEETLQTEMLPCFESLGLILLERQIPVINGSEESALTTWPRMPIAEALEEARKCAG